MMDEITVFDCSGLGMMDVALAGIVYERATDRGLKEIRFK
jgi:ornithine cyclodeaminase/alanine dehydrogenase-like protein (mu-crystallin family)